MQCWRGAAVAERLQDEQDQISQVLVVGHLYDLGEGVRIGWTSFVHSATRTCAATSSKLAVKVVLSFVADDGS